jgi:hypothetical protein
VLDADGQPLPCDDLLVWARWFEEADRLVALDEPVSGQKVSTVFLGLDHQFGKGRPILWESMVFGGPLDGEQQRYMSRDQAVAGHARLVAQVRRANELGGTDDGKDESSRTGE